MTAGGRPGGPDQGHGVLAAVVWWLVRQPLAVGPLLVVAGLWLRSDPGGVGLRRYWPEVVLAGVGVTAAGLLIGGRRRSGSAGVVRRWSRRNRRRNGVASAWDVFRHAGRWTLARRAEVLRPSLAGLSWWRRWTTAGRELGTPLARVGWLRVWSPVEDVTARIAGPRSGKSGELACRILDAPGAVVATSTRVDLYRVTAGLRAGRGPVGVFNPAGLAGLASTVTFDPLAGCADPAVAAARAEDLVPAVDDDGERGHWRSQAVRVLGPLLHAAGLDAELTVRDVHRWLAAPDAARDEVSRLLRRSTARTITAEVQQFFTTNDRTRSSITATVMPALGWVHSETAFAAAGRARSLDVGELLTSRGTVYLLGRQDGMVAPLVAALTAHIAREARRIAEDAPGGRLDPPLTMALDEAAIICPVPLPEWTADMGGRNVTIHLSCQSRAQLVSRWGESGARVILGNTATLLLMGGGNDPEELAAWAALSGHRDEDVATIGPDGQTVSRTVRQVPVISAQQLRQLTVGRAVIFRRSMPPAVGRVELAWQRRDVRRFDRGLRRAERAVVRAAEHAAAHPDGPAFDPVDEAAAVDEDGNIDPGRP